MFICGFRVDQFFWEPPRRFSLTKSGNHRFPRELWCRFFLLTCDSEPSHRRGLLPSNSTLRVEQPSKETVTMGISPSMDCGPCQGDLNASLPSDELSTNILRYKMQKMAMGSWVKAFCSISVETAGSQKCLSWRCFYLWKVLVLRRFLDKMQQMSAGSWVKAFCSISVESAGSQKIPW